jgi:hypothetical protein
MVHGVAGLTTTNGARGCREGGGASRGLPTARTLRVGCHLEDHGGLRAPRAVPMVGAPGAAVGVGHIAGMTRDAASDTTPRSCPTPPSD